MRGAIDSCTGCRMSYHNINGDLLSVSLIQSVGDGSTYLTSFSAFLNQDRDTPVGCGFEN